MNPKQILAEEPLKGFFFMTFVHLKQPVAVNVLNNFWATSASSHLCRMLEASKLNLHARLRQNSKCSA